MRRSRLIIIVFIIIIPILAGGGIFLWYIGGQTLNNSVSVSQTIADNARRPISTQSANPPPFLPPPTYQLKDILASTHDGQTALTDYSRAVATIMSVYNDRAIENELALVVKAAETGNQTAIEKISAASTRHSESALRLKQLVVPPTVTQVHLNLINSLIGLAESSYLMAQIKTKPIVALESAQVYPTRLKNFFTAVNNLNFFLLANNIVAPKTTQTVISLGL